MAILGLDLGKLPHYYRWRRLGAVLIDLILIYLLSMISNYYFHQPDFSTVVDKFAAVRTLPQGDAYTQASMDASRAWTQTWFLFCMIGFGYEALTNLIFSGRTVGKLIFGLKAVPMNPKRNIVLNYVLLVVRSAIKLFTLFFYYAIPFIICGLTVLANKEGRSGFDMSVKTKVIDTRAGKIKRKTK